MTTRAEQGQGAKQPHSYEEFTRRPFYIGINRETIRLVKKPVKYAVDIATGTGAMITQMLEQGLLIRDFQVRGYDIDESALKAAKSAFRNFDGQMLFINAPAENIPLKNGWAQLVTFANAIHLTDAPAATRESARIMDYGATLLINTAYETTHAYPEKSAHSWGILTALARKAARENHGLNDIPNPVPLRQYSVDDYVNMLVSAGLSDIEVYFHTAQMDKEDVKAICRYDEFARIALPDVELDLAKDLLVGAVEPMLERRKSDTIPRGWTIFKARKLPKAT
ncbi:MAG: hypothetical protein A2958_02230 [Candidatus Levybacteria bacterium RIFCSPLOWO2_01_FULL_38_13]|nr:MAG: hypothetical protein A2629_03860 [Candidatus Levybacteria bacterium RIFCSPHIGHO2_01_FULL_41_15]OGH35068.1 MAG: hypothetical protein A2958_02230 [Candidatus Levybacteria bacterium RIFCSPLOWO2_01_FULL_38_13]